jgi:hypothetical protein
MTTLSPRVRCRAAGAAVVLVALTLGAGLAEAQQQAPAPPAPPARPAAAPVVAPPAQVPPPPAPAVTSRGAAVTQAVATAPLRAAPRSGSVVPPDSVRPAPAARTLTAPAGAVARCGDGTFVTASDAATACATHRGVLMRLPLAPGAPPPPTRSMAPVATRVVAADAAPPAGATMRCKDGTYLFGATVPAACDANGGLGVALPSPRSAPPPPSLPRRP